MAANLASIALILSWLDLDDFCMSLRHSSSVRFLEVVLVTLDDTLVVAVLTLGERERMGPMHIKNKKWSYFIGRLSNFTPSRFLMALWAEFEDSKVTKA